MIGDITLDPVIFGVLNFGDKALSGVAFPLSTLHSFGEVSFNEVFANFVCTCVFFVGIFVFSFYKMVYKYMYCQITICIETSCSSKS